MRPPRDKLRPWRILRAERVFTAEPWIEVSRQHVELPGGRIVDDYHRIELTDFALIVAETPDHRLLILRQYRHGVGKVSLSLPADAIVPNEDPLAAACRELLEETGYVASRWRKLGRFVCNANYSCGHAHIFTAKNARRVAQPKSDNLEEYGGDPVNTSSRIARAASRRNRSPRRGHRARDGGTRPESARVQFTAASRATHKVKSPGLAGG